MRRRLYQYLGFGLGALLLVRRVRPRVEVAVDRMSGRAEPVRRRTQPQTAEMAPAPVRKRTGVLAILKGTWKGFMDDECTTLGASVAYFSVFSLAPLLLTVVAAAGLLFGREQIQQTIQQQVHANIGAGAAEQVQTMIAKQLENQSGGIVGASIGLAVLLFGATGAFAALQDALNKTWHVKPDPAAGGIRAFLTKRVLSFGMILGVVFLLIASLAVSTALSAFGAWIGNILPPPLTGWVARALTIAVSFIVIAVLFALILKVLPDGNIAWRDAVVGGVATSILFTIGKTAIAIYLGKAAPASAYGAAGSLVVIVLWLYYASVIVLMGSEFTKVWAAAHGREVRPEAGAVRVVTEERRA